MPEIVAAAITYATPYVGSATAAKVVVYGSMALATGYAAYKLAENKAKRMEAEAKRKARNRSVEVQNLQFGTTASRRFVYGETITNGHLVFQETAGTSNKDLYRVVYLGEGPFQEASQVYFNEEAMSHGDLDTLSGTNVTNSPYGGYNNIQVFLGGGVQNGTSGSAAAQLISSTTWSNTDKMTDNATLVYRLRHNNEVWTNGIPNIRVKVKGRKLYDPRLDGSISGGTGSHRVANESTWEYSNNPALCILDFLLNGMDVDSDSIDMQSFQAAANTCDDNVTILDSDGNTTTEKRFTMNGVVFLEEEVIGILEQMLATCHGILVEEAGTVRIFVPGEATTAVVSLDEDDYISELNISINTAFDKRINSISGTFTDPNGDYMEGDFGVVESSSLISEDGRTHKQSIALPYVTSESQAQRLASIVLKENALTLAVTVTLKPKYSYLRVGDIVTMRFAPDVIGGYDNDEIISTTTKFMVTKWTMNMDSSITVELQEYSDDSYDWNTGDHNYIQRSSPADSFIVGVDQPTLGTTTQYNTLDAVGNEVVGFLQEVTHASHPNFLHTNVALQVKMFTGGSNYAWRTVDSKDITDGNVVFQNVPPKDASGTDLEYRLIAKTVLITGHVSSEAILFGSTFNAKIAADTTPPSAPTSLGGSGGYRANNLTWTNPTDIDFDRVEIYRHTSNASASATAVGESYGTSFTDSKGLSDNTTYFYWLKAIDRVGNKSVFSQVHSITTQNEIGDGAENRHLDLQTTSGASLNASQQQISISTSNTSWDQSVHSSTSYTGGAQVTFGVNQTTKKIMIGLNTDPTTDASYTSIDYAWYANISGTAQIYENGTNIGNMGTYTANSVFTITYDNDKIRYYLDGVLKRTVDVSADLEFHLDSSFRDNGNNQTRFFNFTPMGAKGTTGDTGVSTLAIYQVSKSVPTTPSASTGVPTGWSDTMPTKTDNIWLSIGTRSAGGTNYNWDTPTIITQHKPNVLENLDALPWTGGTGSNTVNSYVWGHNGSTGEQLREVDTDPFNGQSMMWKAINGGNDNSADGGFNGPKVPVDGTKLYRFTIFMKQDDNAGSKYWGLHTYNSSGSTLGTIQNGGTTTTNPYFWSGDLPSSDEWYMIVGYLRPIGSTATSNESDHGIYKVSTGERVSTSGQDFRMPTGTTQVHCRSYLYYDTTTAANEVWMFEPRIDLMDERAPSIKDLLRTGSKGDQGDEGTAILEVSVFRKNNNTAPSGGSYNFATQTLTAPTGWSASQPSLTADGDVVYRVQGTASGTSSTTSASITWGTAHVVAKRTDGDPGAAGDRGPGRWNISVSSLPTDSSSASTAFGSTGGGAVEDDQAWFYTGSESNPTAQAVFIYNGSSWNEQTEVIDGSLLVSGSITSDRIESGTIEADRIKSGEVFSSVSLKTGNITLNTDGEQPRPQGQTAGFFAVGSNTAVSGATAGDVAFGSYDQYVSWDDSEGVLELAGRVVNLSESSTVDMIDSRWTEIADGTDQILRSQPPGKFHIVLIGGGGNGGAAMRVNANASLQPDSGNQGNYMAATGGGGGAFISFIYEWTGNNATLRYNASSNNELGQVNVNNDTSDGSNNNATNTRSFTSVISNNAGLQAGNNAGNSNGNALLIAIGNGGMGQATTTRNESIKGGHGGQHGAPNYSIRSSMNQLEFTLGYQSVNFNEGTSTMNDTLYGQNVTLTDNGQLNNIYFSDTNFHQTGARGNAAGFNKIWSNTNSNYITISESNHPEFVDFWQHCTVLDARNGMQAAGINAGAGPSATGGGGVQLFARRHELLGNNVDIMPPNSANLNNSLNSYGAALAGAGPYGYSDFYTREYAHGGNYYFGDNNINAGGGNQSMYTSMGYALVNGGQGGSTDPWLSVGAYREVGPLGVNNSWGHRQRFLQTTGRNNPNTVLSDNTHRYQVTLGLPGVPFIGGGAVVGSNYDSTNSTSLGEPWGHAWAQAGEGGLGAGGGALCIRRTNNSANEFSMWMNLGNTSNIQSSFLWDANSNDLENGVRASSGDAVTIGNYNVTVGAGNGYWHHTGLFDYTNQSNWSASAGVAGSGGIGGGGGGAVMAVTSSINTTNDNTVRAGRAGPSGMFIRRIS